MTQDVGFADITVYPPCDFSGIVVLRLATQVRRNQVAVLTRMFAEIEAQGAEGKLFIVSERGIRVRGR